MLDVVIVGAGFAGLSAALVLGRCRRRVVVCDGGPPRNRPSGALHAFLTRDGEPPGRVLGVAREQLGAYPDVTLTPGPVADLSAHPPGGFVIARADGSTLHACHVLLATGIADVLPSLPGFAPLYGRSVFACPYCDAWEVRDRPLAAYGRGPAVAGLARTLCTWSDDVVLVTDGPAEMDDEARSALASLRVRVREEPVACLAGADGRLEAIRFVDGTSLPRAALFFTLGQRQRSALPARIGCRLSADGGVEADPNGATSVPGVWVAGDASRDVQLAIVAAAEGARAAFAINKVLAAR